ncbi:MAG TPA: N-acetyl-1-D-myo-inositol-2-amino-2-deoxy-alpha-D-glucopyranoside deacetylase [Chloroflexota bacterium]
MSVDTRTDGSAPTLMAVRAHPDDESIVCGGTLARYSAEGADTIVVTCTLGESGQIVDPTMNADEVRARLGEVRRLELEESCRILGVSSLEILGYRDSGMAGTPDNDNPASFNRADPIQAGDRLVALVRRYRPHVLLTDDETGGYGHPDHIMANRITVHAFERSGDPAYRQELGAPWQPLKLYYGLFPRSQFIKLREEMEKRGLEVPWSDEEFDDTEAAVGSPDSAITTTIDVGAFLPQKNASLRAHHTQIAPDDWWATLPADIGEQLFHSEYFQLAKSRVDVPEHETDLFTGVETGKPSRQRAQLTSS